MALSTINEIIFDRLPFLVNNQESVSLIERQKSISFVHLQANTKFTDDEAFEESKYNGTLRLLAAELTAYRILEREIKKSVSEGSKKIKKVKADVVETEFEYGKASDGNGFLKNADSILSDLKESIAGYCATLNYFIPGFRESKTPILPIAFYSLD